MNKKLMILALLPSMVLVGCGDDTPSGGDEPHVVPGEKIVFDTDTIEALSHKDGVTVNFVNNDIANYWESDATDLDKLKTLYEMNTEIDSFNSNSFNHEYVRNLYAKWDDYKPINNTLTWKSKISVDHYSIVVSLNPELTEVVYEKDGLKESSYTMSNPYSNTHYYWQVTAYTGQEKIKSPIFDFYAADYKRTIDIPTVSNTRDVGGFSGKYGEMKQGLIYRSARFDDADDSCQEALLQLGIQTDLDLRSFGEGLDNPANLPRYYRKTLLSYAQDFQEANRAQTIEAVKIFANPINYPVIFHCAVGRDRTGTLAIILQALCGASKEYIIHDYYTSMWSVTGAYSKSFEQMNLNLLNEVFTELETLGAGSLSTGAENFLKVREDKITHEMVGLTVQEIQSIRDIWSGKLEVTHAPKPHKAVDNYEGKTLVTFKASGHKDVVMMTEKGKVIVAPYKLNKAYVWFADGKLFDFSTPINDVTVIYADYATPYVIYIHFMGIKKEDEILKVYSGTTLTFEKYEIKNYEMTVISDEGKEISSLRVIRDAHINIVYIKG